MMVTSPGCGFGLFLGMYCFTAKRSLSSWLLAVARAYSRMCWASTMCSLTVKCREDMARSWAGQGGSLDQSSLPDVAQWEGESKHLFYMYSCLAHSLAGSHLSFYVHRYQSEMRRDMKTKPCTWSTRWGGCGAE